MTLRLTQNDFKKHTNKYLDKVSDQDETLYVSRSKGRSVTVISQQKMNYIETALRAKEESLDYAIPKDQLIKRGFLPDDEIVQSNDKYWD
ncbi:type II toxin-antitoxin system Phd/YefM family antitoxin [Xylocopilactobacillus apis]|uniref:Antitoxin n=1 Tax=Xylocopilactobacillus apis TaxID=2932183 RepID=A0AAU9DTN5_9LACO|nr:type II toxin-antitoxin system Phd/YefM family antitoxin [Xylocopilactobacillus apis]BDR57138.1 antitoxin [Xylocopilactobacillus apis]